MRTIVDRFSTIVFILRCSKMNKKRITKVEQSRTKVEKEEKS